MPIRLKAGWTAEELANANAYLDVAANKTPEALRELFEAVVPNLFASYKIVDLDHFADTPFAGLPRRGVFPIKEHLNSLKPRGNDTDYAPFYYPIIVEVEVATDVWLCATELTGREMLADGTIYLPILRQLPIANWDWTNNTQYTTPLVAKNIRFTSVLFGDARVNMTAWQQGFRDKLGGNFCSGVNYNLDAQSFVQGFRRGEIIDTRLYAYQFRTSLSKPIPASSPGASNAGNYVAPTFGAATLREDSQKALKHAERVMWERACLQKAGQLEYEGRIENVALGTTIQKFMNSSAGAQFTANAIVTGVLYKSEKDSTKSIVYIGTHRGG